MEREELIALTPSEFYSIQQKRRQQNEKESSQVKEYFGSVLIQSLKDEIDKEKIVILETRLSVSRHLRMGKNRPIILDLSFVFRRYPSARVIFPTGLIVEVEIIMGYKSGLETRIIPQDTDEFQRLRAYLSDWESRSKYYPGKGNPDMLLFHIEDCTGKTIKEMCDLTVSKIKEIITGDFRNSVC